MTSRRVLLVAALLIQATSAWAETQAAAPVPEERQLSGLGSAEAEALIGKLQRAQQRLKAGDEGLLFELVVGSLASNEMTKVSPYEAFLAVPFDKAWNIQRVRTNNRLWQPYRLSYAPDGLGQLYWDIEVATGFNGNIERVMMVYKPPAPF